MAPTPHVARSGLDADGFDGPKVLRRVFGVVVLLVVGLEVFLAFRLRHYDLRTGNVPSLVMYLTGFVLLCSVTARDRERKSRRIELRTVRAMALWGVGILLTLLPRPPAWPQFSIGLAAMAGAAIDLGLFRRKPTPSPDPDGAGQGAAP